MSEPAVRAYLACRGLSRLQWDLLEVLANGRTIADYNRGAKNLRSARAAASRALAALEKRGLVTRAPAELTELGAIAARDADEIQFQRDFTRRHYRMVRQAFGHYDATPVNSHAASSGTVNVESAKLEAA